jgi:hypothetical protein
MTTTQTLVRKGHLNPDQEKSYMHVPFDLPAGVERIDVFYDYSERISSDPTVSGGNTIDLGVFDERGIDYLNAGFRGWSGSDRASFWITGEEATPGYLAGPLNPGTWHVLLGLYKISPNGCDYTVKVILTIGEPLARYIPLSLPEGNLPSSQPAARRNPWLVGELHCHTFHSDGTLSPKELIGLAEDRGLDFLAVSDHNTIAAQRDLAHIHHPGLVLIRAVESTTFKGHFNIWGIPDWVDFRVQKPQDIQDAIEFANKRGALTSCNHPKPYGPNWDFPQVANHHCVEVWNGPWTGLNEVSLEYWLELIASGRQVPAVGGSDFHSYCEWSGNRERMLGSPANWVYVPGEPNQANILSAIRQGHVSLSEDPQGPYLELRGGENYEYMGGDRIEGSNHGGLPIQVFCQGGSGAQLRLLDQNGALLEKIISSEEITLPYIADTSHSLYIRCELRSSDFELRAITNPIYF